MNIFEDILTPFVLAGIIILIIAVLSMSSSLFKKKLPVAKVATQEQIENIISKREIGEIKNKKRENVMFVTSLECSSARLNIAHQEWKIVPVEDSEELKKLSIPFSFEKEAPEELWRIRWYNLLSGKPGIVLEIISKDGIIKERKIEQSLKEKFQILEKGYPLSFNFYEMEQKKNQNS
jgi:hypothetical protein